jgi:hypothetical protein
VKFMLAQMTINDKFSTYTSLNFVDTRNRNGNYSICTGRIEHNFFSKMNHSLNIIFHTSHPPM